MTQYRDVIRLDYDEDQARDPSGRWTGGGNPAMAGTDENTGLPLKPRAYELHMSTGEVHRFSDRKGEKDTFTFPAGSHDQLTRSGEAKERLIDAIRSTAKDRIGYTYNGPKTHRDPADKTHIIVQHAYHVLFKPGFKGDVTEAPGGDRARNILEPAGHYKRLK